MNASSPVAPLVDVRNLKTYFPVAGGVLQRTTAYVHAVDGVDLAIHRGETLGLVGESGCGKSTLGLTMLRLVDATAGEVRFEGVDLLRISDAEMRQRRRDMAMIFQDPFASLDSRQTIGEIIAEPLFIHRLASNAKQRNRRVVELLGLVGLNAKFINRYPHEFSGGERQRVGIARALACDPKFIVCDEPIAALDVSIQAQIVNLLERLQDELGLTYLFISHDLAIARYIADRIAVMYLGKVVELAQAADLYWDPKHPYTGSLISAIPIPDPQVERGRSRLTIKGEVPSPVNPPSGCRFRTRCFRAADRCGAEVPTLAEVQIGDHSAACFYPLESEAGARPHLVTGHGESFLLFVNGTLMRGLALHGSLEGAKFLGQVSTAPHYRLYSIADIHPGMFETSEAGVSVLGELYEVSDEIWQRVEANEPAHLYRGPINLSDGRTVDGILYPRELAEGRHRDISSYADWRDYVKTLMAG